jgi:sulfite exporter TauE/SafE
LNNELFILLTTAISIGFIHTLLGPDHYLPFIVLSRARHWSSGKTLWISFLCGLGHVLSSVILGLVGLALGLAVFTLEGVEAWRGNVAAWLLIGFGLVYALWGIQRGIRNKPHRHLHFHQNGLQHEHVHTHRGEHLHPHDESPRKITPWILFIIFVFGPCEPLIPLLLYPAAKHSWSGVILVAVSFSIVTILTMLTLIYLGSRGIKLIRLGFMERYVHAFAGGVIFISGLGIKFLGL